MSSNGQVLNPDMENWSGNDLSDWFDLNQYIVYGLPQTAFPETTGVPSGSSALKLETVLCLICPSIPGFGPSDTIIPGVILQNQQYIGMPDSLVFYYKYTPSGVDTAIVNFAVTLSGVTQGNANFYIFSAASWTRLALPVSYIGGAQNSDSLDISFASSYANNPKVGSELFIDNISLVSSASGVSSLLKEIDVSLFPNPCSGLLNINSSTLEAKSFVIYTNSGKRIFSTNLTGLNNTIDLTELANGNYFYSISDEKGFALKQGKIQLIK